MRLSDRVRRNNGTPVARRGRKVRSLIETVRLPTDLGTDRSYRAPAEARVSPSFFRGRTDGMEINLRESETGNEKDQKIT